MADREPKSEQDFLQMQQEAIRRVRDMQARARQTLEDAGVPLEPPSPPVPPRREPTTPLPQVQATARTFEEAAPPPPPEENPLPHAPHSPRHEPEMPFHLALDSEQIMLLLIIYLLYKDHGDQYLMMALAYLLLT